MSQQRPPSRSILAERWSRGTVIAVVAAPVRTAAFWLAVLLPLAYPLALYLGDGSAEHSLAVGALLVVHLAALSVGHGHRPD